MYPKLRDYFQNRPDFSGAVLVAVRDQIVFQQAFGYADREQGIPNTVQTRFRAASGLTKPVTALAILQLVEQGRLSLDDSIDAYFPAYKGQGVTIRHLLNHTSGIPNHVMHLRKELPWHEDHTPQQIYRAVSRHGLRFRPGSKFSYNNTAFLMLGLVVEQLTGMSYHQYVRQHIFEPAGMIHSGFEADDPDGVALGYIKHRPGPHIGKQLFFACGDIVTTVHDMFRFMHALKSGQLVRLETVGQMEQPTYSNRMLSVGLAWSLKQVYGRKTISHGGYHVTGQLSFIERYLDDEMTVIVLSNDVISHAPLMLKEFGSCFIGREVAGEIFGQRLPFWHKIL